MAVYTVKIENGDQLLGFAMATQPRPSPGKVTQWQEAGGIGGPNVERIPVQREPDEIEIHGVAFTTAGLTHLNSPATLGDALAKGPFRLVIMDDQGEALFVVERCDAKDSLAFREVPISEASQHAVKFHVFDSWQRSEAR